MTRLRRQIGAGTLVEKGCFPCVLSGISQCGVDTPRASYSGLVESSTGHCRSCWVSAVGWVSGGLLLSCEFRGELGDGAPLTSSSLIGHSWQAAAFHTHSKTTKSHRDFNFCSSYCKLNAKEVHGQELELCGVHFQRRQGSLLAAGGSKF